MHRHPLRADGRPGPAATHDFHDRGSRASLGTDASWNQTARELLLPRGH
jgi:hypothetical protein